jgi:hypothetical protein
VEIQINGDFPLVHFTGKRIVRGELFIAGWRHLPWEIFAGRN